jgi:nucleotide-binding universal stress UspA family protein
MDGSELHVFHAWAHVSRWLWVAGSRMTEAEMAQLDRTNEEVQLRKFDELLGKVPLNDLLVRRHLVEGEPSHQIVRLARAEHIDVIVMGTVCRAGVPGLFIGNTAEKVLRQVSCAVLTVKPDGFLSPVTL